MRQSIITSKIIQSPLQLSEVFYLATLGGAKALNLANVGNFAQGKDFDAILIDLNSIDVFEGDNINVLFEKLIYLGDDRNVKKVWVNGTLVVNKEGNLC